MAGPCGCKGAGCGCCFIENPSSEVPYEVFGSGSPSDCVSLNIKNIVTTLADNGDGTLTYTNELGNSVTFFDGEHYSVDVIGELVGNTPVPNTVAGTATVFGVLSPLTVTIVNPSTVRDMSIHTSGTGEEVALVGARTVAASQNTVVQCKYSLNGGPLVDPKIGGGQAQVPLTSGELRTAHAYSVGPIFVDVVTPGGSWFIRLAERRYVLTGLLNAGSITAQGQKIAISGSTTV